jgi:hypothetical protein
MIYCISFRAQKTAPLVTQVTHNTPPNYLNFFKKPAKLGKEQMGFSAEVV